MRWGQLERMSQFQGDYMKLLVDAFFRCIYLFNFRMRADSSIRIILSVLTFGWILGEPSFVCANAEITVSGMINAFQAGSFELIKYVVVGLVMLLVGKILSLFGNKIGDTVEGLLIAIKERPAILKGTGLMAYQLTAETGELERKPVEYFVTPFPTQPTYKNGSLQATRYEFENVILMHWGKRARFKATLYGLVEGKQIWKAKVIGSGTHVGRTDGTLGDFYFQCECATDQNFSSGNKGRQPRAVWAVAYVLRNFPSDAGYHFEGHWLLRSANNNSQARFGTINLKSGSRVTIGRLLRMVLWD